MRVLKNFVRPVFAIPGIRHQTLAGTDDGLNRVEIWNRRLGPQATTPHHYHECDEVVVVLEGKGEVVTGTERVGFAAQTTLILPAGLVHQIINTGDAEMILLVVLSETPARVFAPNGDPIALPWQKGGGRAAN